MAFAVERLIAFVPPRAEPGADLHVEDCLTPRATDPANLLQVGVRLQALAGCIGPVDGIYFSRSVPLKRLPIG